MHKAKVVVSLLMLLALAACEVVPQQPGEAVAFGYITHKALTRSVTDAVKNGSITADQAEQASVALHESAVYLKAAKTAVETNDPAAGDTISRALSFLRVVDSILSQQGVNHGQ